MSPTTSKLSPQLSQLLQASEQLRPHERRTLEAFLLLLRGGTDHLTTEHNPLSVPAVAHYIAHDIELRLKACSIEAGSTADVTAVASALGSSLADHHLEAHPPHLMDGVVEHAAAAVALYERAHRTTPQEISADEYVRMRGAVPPAAMCDWAFLMGEPMGGSPDERLYEYFYTSANKYFRAGVITIQEFDERVADDREIGERTTSAEVEQLQDDDLDDDSLRLDVDERQDEARTQHARSNRWEGATEWSGVEVPTWMKNSARVYLPMFDDHDTGAGSNSGVVLECEPLRGRVSVETDDGQLEFWRLADVAPAWAREERSNT